VEIMVPTPSWVNSSSSAEPSMSNGTMWALDAVVAGLDAVLEVERGVGQEAGRSTASAWCEDSSRIPRRRHPSSSVFP
jgi:hypothetical protein